ncbi:Alpha-tocopherol transfer protein-like protein [Operophtera brumata]|uniref:Alpha-tocopherol transfer protein-like protein n=1 Tax=Operophtera brumata TaxID=104452 RepID=A0A0L7L378_OPEBR|nr:Alpha-tocopherol transfer protein-like protein [Operophtera brumata]
MTTSKTVEVFVKILKQMFSTKIGNRIYVHMTLESLHEHVPKECLPEELGGYDKSLASPASSVVPVSTMQRLPEDALLKYHPDTMLVVRKMYNLDKPGQMEEAVDILDTWLIEYIKSHDYCDGIISIADIRGINITNFVAELNLTELRQIITIVIVNVSTTLVPKNS